MNDTYLAFNSPPGEKTRPFSSKNPKKQQTSNKKDEDIDKQKKILALFIM